VRYRLMASYLGSTYQAAVGPTDRDVTLFAGLPPPEEHGFSPAPGGIWSTQVQLGDLDALWESRPVGSYRGEPCLVLDDLGDRLHIVYLGMDKRQAERLGYWEVDRGVYEVVASRSEVASLAEERHEFPIALLLSALPPAEASAGAADQPSAGGRHRVGPSSSSPAVTKPHAVPAALVGKRPDPAPARFPAAEVPDDATAVFDLAIRRGRTPGEFDVEVLASDTGEGASTIEIDLDGLLARRDGIQLAVLASTVASRRVVPETEKPVREMGRVLFRSLLGTGEVAGQYRAAAAVAAGRGQRLRITLRIDAPEIAALPWETMYDDAAGAYVCRDGQLIRHVGVARAPAPLSIRPPLRILGVVSSPRGLSSLDARREQENLSRALAKPLGQGLVEMHWAPAATWEDLHSMLLAGPWHVVHYIGHGDFDDEQDEGYLALVGDDGGVHRVAAHRLVDLLRQASPMPRLVVLNSCAGARASTSDLSSSTAAALARGGASAVAAMQFAISDPAAAAFARGFYTAIAHGRGIDDAITSGRVGILGTGDFTLEWLTPVLYLRGRDARLFDVS
jgi:CHAT domain